MTSEVVFIFRAVTHHFVRDSDLQLKLAGYLSAEPNYQRID